MLYTDYNHVVEMPHPAGPYLGYATVDSETGEVFTDDTHCDSYCKVGDSSELVLIDPKSRFMTEPLWVLGGWSDEDEFHVDCSCEGYGRDSGTGWVERQLLSRIPREYALRRGII